MSYSFDKPKTNRWSELNDEYQSMLDELAEVDDTDDVFISVDDFDLDEVL